MNKFTGGSVIGPIFGSVSLRRHIQVDSHRLQSNRSDPARSDRRRDNCDLASGQRSSTSSSDRHPEQQTIIVVPEARSSLVRI